MNEWLYNVAFSIGDFDITYGNIALQVLIFILLAVFYILIRNRFLPRFFEKEEIEVQDRYKIKRLLRFCFLLGAIVSLEWGFQIDYTLLSSQYIEIRVSNLLLTILLLLFARLLDVLISKYLIHTYYENRGRKEQELGALKKDNKESTHRKVRQVVYLIGLQMIVNILNINYILFSFDLNDKTYEIKVSDILAVLLIFAFARLLNWVLIQLVLHRYYKKVRADIGRQYAINRLMVYFVYVAAVIIALEMMGFNLTLVWGGLAALLLGVGLGLQQTFNDLASGIILLFERTVEVGDIVEINGTLGLVKQIGLRTSRIETHDSISVIIPNSQLVTEKVRNWNHYDEVVRFSVSVGVAYGSDTALVRRLLIEVALNHPDVLKEPAPFARFTEFADSALHFELFFWSKLLFPIENVKSDIRFEIDQAFRKNNVTIPFPQRDVWLRDSAQK